LYTIYKITNVINGKEYIGKHKTEDLNDGYFGSGKLLKKAIKKYGKENFKKEILFVFESELEVDIKEAELVTEKFCSWSNTYNICVGGRGGFSYINNSGLNNENKNWDVIKLKISMRKKGVKQPLSSLRMKKMHKEGKIKPPKHSCIGYRHTEKTKQKMSITHMGSKNSQYGTCWITNGQDNKKINKNDLESWLKLGYMTGRAISHC
jgi:hypothetical protein